MTREALDELELLATKKRFKLTPGEASALDVAIKALEAEPLTDTEQRIFLKAMSREEKVCKEVCADGEGVDLVTVCHRIERKVKKALWK